jgi:hypothetical protein
VQQQRESAGELNLSRAREVELKAEVERLAQRLQVAETSSESAKKEWAERERVLQERFVLTQQLLKRQTDQYLPPTAHVLPLDLNLHSLEHLRSEEKLKREEMAKQRSAATEACAPAATLAEFQAPSEEQPEEHHLQKEDLMQEERAPTVRKERRWDGTVLTSHWQMVREMFKQTPEEPAHATTTACSRALGVTSSRAVSVEPSPRREMSTVESSSRPVCLINIGDEEEEPAIPLACSPPPKSRQRSAAFPSPKKREAEPTFFSSLEEPSESDHRNKEDESEHIAHSLASPVVPSPTSDAGSGNRRRSRLRQTQPSTAAALVERNLCSCGQPGYGLMVPPPPSSSASASPKANMLASVLSAQYRCRICGRPYHKECVDDGGGHAFGTRAPTRPTLIGAYQPLLTEENCTPQAHSTHASNARRTSSNTRDESLTRRGRSDPL